MAAKNARNWRAKRARSAKLYQKAHPKGPKSMNSGSGTGRTITLQTTLIHFEDGGSWRLVFASASIAFSTMSFQPSRSRPRCFIWAFTDGLSPSRKNRMRSDPFGAPSAYIRADSLEVLEVRSLVSDFLLLILSLF